MYLPDCTCETEEICKCHIERNKTLRNALRAVKAGKITRIQYDMWLKKYPGKKVVRPFN